MACIAANCKANLIVEFMNNLPFSLTERQMGQIRPFFPHSRGVQRVDDCKVVSGIIYVTKNRLQWKDAPRQYAPHKPLYNRFVRWSAKGVFAHIFRALARGNESGDVLMIDSTYLKAHQIASSLSKKGAKNDSSDAHEEELPPNCMPSATPRGNP